MSAMASASVKVAKKRSARDVRLWSFKLGNLTYNIHVNMKNTHTRNKLIDFFNTSKFEMIDNIKSDNKRIQANIDKMESFRSTPVKLEIFISNLGTGFGVRAAEFIPQFSKIGLYTGNMVRKRGREPNIYTFSAGPYWIDAETCGNELRFVNHACGKFANVTSVLDKCGRVVFEAKVDIKVGEELLTSYGKGFLDYNDIECRCPAKRHLAGPEGNNKRGQLRINGVYAKGPAQPRSSKGTFCKAKKAKK